MVQRKQNPSSSLPYYSVTAVAIVLAFRLFQSADAYVVPNRPIAFVGLTQQQQTVANNRGQQSSPANNNNRYHLNSAADSLGAAEDAIPEPSLTTFREAEVLGLRLMQEGNYEEALKVFQKGMKLPGSNKDVVRTKSLSGPSPVGGSMGGFESQSTQPLDEFELQAAHYNIACAHAQLGNLDESIFNLQKSFENGFNNFATVRGDPDLDPVKDQSDYKKLMNTYDAKGFNPFGFLGSKQ